MRLITTSLFTALAIIATFSSAYAQESSEASKIERDKPAAAPVTEANEATITPATQAAPPVFIHLVGGSRMQVDEATESADSVWYRRGNVSTFLDRVRVERIERGEAIKPPSIPAPAPKSGNWSISDSTKVEGFFMAKFGRRLPSTAFGQSELHTRWGLDHRQGIDVGLHPDSPEGRALIKFLSSEGIPFLAFRSAVPNAATGPHIHIGNRSHRLRAR